jgi:membrane-bound lytic murein transglycosylase MltF
MRLENIKHEIGADFEIVETPHTRCDYLLEMVSNGQIDYVACDYETASDKLEKFSNLDIKTEISFTQFKAWAINKDSVYLLQQLDSFLQKKVTMHAIDGLNKK